MLTPSSAVAIDLRSALAWRAIRDWRLAALTPLLLKHFNSVLVLYLHHGEVQGIRASLQEQTILLLLNSMVFCSACCNCEHVSLVILWLVTPRLAPIVQSGLVPDPQKSGSGSWDHGVLLAEEQMSSKRQSFKLLSFEPGLVRQAPAGYGS